LFPLSYAESLKNDYPEIWSKGGNIQGNDTYRVITRIREEGKSADELTANDKEIIKMREAWSARHFEDYRLAGVVAQIKWHMVGYRGLDHMKSVINDAKDKLKKSNDITADDMKALWKKIDDKREKLIVKTKREIKKYFEDQQNKMMRRLKNANDNNIERIANQVVDDTSKNIRNILIAMNRVAIEDFGMDSYNDYKNQKMMTKAFEPYNDLLSYWITLNVGNAVTLVDDTTKREIKDIIIESVALGWGIGNEDTPDTIAFAIGQLYLDQIIPNRSETIARTEVMTAANKGSLEGAQQSGAELLKFWIPTYDGDTRDSHMEVGQHPAIELDQLFQVGQSQGEFPADARLSAKERINCRCAVGYKRKRQN
jgi:hypothetical protein